MRTQNLTNLFYRYLQNECNEQEISSLLKHFDKEEHTAELKTLIEQQLLAKNDAELDRGPAVKQVFERTDRYFQDTLFPKKRSSSMRIYPYIRYGVAASILVIFMVTVYLLNQGNSNSPVKNKTTTLVNDALPGKDKAILTLADGSSVALGTEGNSTIVKNAGIKISKTKDGVLVYEVLASQAVEPNKLIYNQLHTPNGAKYEIFLPDGTKVWLNASSTLRYPVAFATNERRVELTGEAYFEVKKVTVNDKRIPFFVKTPDQTIQVLGTEFNVNAYPDEPVTKTTLVSGKVNVRTGNGDNGIVLVPGEQAISTKTGAVQIAKVNAESVIAWKNGNFMFEDEDLKDILKQLSRWYNVDVDLNKVPKTHYNILVSRGETLKSVINMLERTGNIKFQISNNTIKILN